jgi:hypothetical protein
MKKPPATVAAINSFVFGHHALRSGFAWLELVGRVGGEAVTRHLFKSNGGLRRSLSSGRALRGPVGLQSAPTRYAPLTRRANHLASARASNCGVSIPSCKNISVFPKCKSCYMICHPVPERGALAIVTNVGAGSGGRGSARAQERSQGGFPVSDQTAHRRTALQRTAKACGPDVSAVGVKSRGGFASPTGRTKPYSRGDGVKQARSPGRARHRPLKPLRRESRIASAGPVCSCACFCTVLHTRPRVQRASGFPCALFFRGQGIFFADLGRIAPRERGRMHGDLPSLRALARGGEGSGVGGLSAWFSASECADAPPTPDPSPPLRGGEGRNDGRLFEN